MNGDLLLTVFDPQSEIAPFLRDIEPDIENEARRVFGRNVDIHVRKQTLPAILSEAPADTTRSSTWCVANLTRGSRVVTTFGKLVEGLISHHLQSILVVTTPEIMNMPEFQSLALDSGESERIRFAVEESDHVVHTANVLPLLTELFRAERETALERAEDEQREAQHPPYLLASSMIRNPSSGRLDARRVSDVFDLSMSRIADLSGVTKQAVSQTPDSKRIQSALKPFEKITRAMILTHSDPSEFRYWLNSPSDDLPQRNGDHMSPYQMIELGHPEVVAALVENRLTGHPS